jgi:hypothetical protein
MHLILAFMAWESMPPNHLQEHRQNPFAPV